MRWGCWAYEECVPLLSLDEKVREPTYGCAHVYVCMHLCLVMEGGVEYYQRKYILQILFHACIDVLHDYTD